MKMNIKKNNIINYTQEPKVILINWTLDPIETMCLARRVMHFPVPDTLQELKENPEKWLGMSLDDYVNNVLLKDSLATFLEYVTLNFKLENVSRSFTHQKVRDRIGWSYSQQSMRCVPANEFASKGLYYMPENIINKEEYHKKMLLIQDIYNDALKNGASVQDARGLLPMNIYTTITFSCSLRAFIACVNKRLCWKVQDEYKKIAELMIKEVLEKIDPRLEKWIGAPCKVSNYKYCMMAGECEQQYKAGKLTGSQNTAYCCPIYLNKFVKK